MTLRPSDFSLPKMVLNRFCHREGIHLPKQLPGMAALLNGHPCIILKIQWILQMIVILFTVN